MATKKAKKGGAGKLAATLIGAAATGYYFYGPKGAQNRQKAKAWSLKAKAEVLEQFEKAKDVTDKSYAEAVDKVTAKYAKMKAVGKTEATKLNKELKGHWGAIKKSAEKESK